MKFSQDFIDRVRDASDLVSIVRQHVELRDAGNEHQGLCPFHNEKSPSFSVSGTKQVYHCFGCKASGNVFRFVQNFQGLTFPETVEYLANRAGIALPAGSVDEDSARGQRTLFYKINGAAALFYHNELKKLPDGHDVKRYLTSRGLDDATVEAFKLGYAPDNNQLTQFFKHKNVPNQAAEALGLIKYKHNHYDFFRHRLMFPIFSPSGQCLGFGGRSFTKEQQPKYLNSTDSSVFHKGKVFYGLDHSAKYVRTNDEAIVVEGYMDWLALAKVGINNAVATLGTALTHDHARLISRYSKRVLVLFDGDEAGKTAARRSLPILLSEGLFARGLFLPDELDPDEFITERGVPALRQLIQSAPDLFELITAESWSHAKGSPTGKVQLLDEFAPVLAQIQDQRLRRLYSENLARLVDVDVKLVEQSVQPANRAARPAATAPKVEVSQAIPPIDEPRPRFDLTKAPRIELELLNVILMREVYLKGALEAGVGEQFMHPGCAAVYKRIAEVYGQLPNKFDTLSALLADEVKPVETITRHLSEFYANLSDEQAGKLLQDCIKRVKSDFLRSKSKELVSSLRGTGEANPSEQLEQIMNIHKNRRDLNRDS